MFTPKVRMARLQEEINKTHHFFCALNFYTLTSTSRSLSWIFSQTRGTPRNLVGRTSTNVCKKIINTPPSKHHHHYNNTWTNEPFNASLSANQTVPPAWNGMKMSMTQPAMWLKNETVQQLFDTLNNRTIHWTIEQYIEQYIEQLADTFFYLKDLRGR